MVVLSLCFILALNSKPPKKLIMYYAYSRMLCDDKRSLGRSEKVIRLIFLEILTKNAVITKIRP